MHNPQIQNESCSKKNELSYKKKKRKQKEIVNQQKGSISITLYCFYWIACSFLNEGSHSILCPGPQISKDDRVRSCGFNFCYYVMQWIEVVAFILHIVLK